VYFLLDCIYDYMCYRVASSIAHTNGSMTAMEAMRMSGEYSLCSLGQALYKQLDLGFYIVGKIHRKPSQLPLLILRLLLMKVWNGSTRPSCNLGL
jgi:hypothetical protein